MDTNEHYRFTCDSISYTAWSYYCFTPCHQDIEVLMVERDITVSQASTQLCFIESSAKYARRLTRRHQGYCDTFAHRKVMPVC
jgi:putative transposase